jgi:hypothetical protein
MSLFLIGMFLFLSFGADLSHTHDDCCHHDECSACTWLIYSVVILTFSLYFSGFLRALFRKALVTAVSFILEFRDTTRSLRSPPKPASL